MIGRRIAITGWVVFGIALAGWIRQPGSEFTPEPNPAWAIGTLVGLVMALTGHWIESQRG